MDLGLAKGSQSKGSGCPDTAPVAFWTLQTLHKCAMAHWPLPGDKNSDECTKFSPNFNEIKLCCHSLCLWELVRTHQCCSKQGKCSWPEAPGVMEPLERWDLPLVPWAGLSWRFLALTPSSRRIQLILFHEQFPLKLLLQQGEKKEIYLFLRTGL